MFGEPGTHRGNITISPVKERPVENMKIENARLYRKVFCVDICKNHFSVISEGRVITSKSGEAVVI